MHFSLRNSLGVRPGGRFGNKAIIKVGGWGAEGVWDLPAEKHSALRILCLGQLSPSYEGIFHATL